MARVLGVLIAGVALLVVGTCGSGGSDVAAKPTTTALTTSTVPVPGAGDGTFTMTTERFVDPSRPTGASPGRSLPTDIYVPGGKGPFPVIVHSHGNNGASRKFTQLLGERAKAGYIVVAAELPADPTPTRRRTRNPCRFHMPSPM